MKSLLPKEQMDQAARSSKQCLAEGATQGTSLKGYIKMIGITHGSFEELLEDYEVGQRIFLREDSRNKMSNLKIHGKIKTNLVGCRSGLTGRSRKACGRNPTGVRISPPPPPFA